MQSQFPAQKQWRAIGRKSREKQISYIGLNWYTIKLRRGAAIGKIISIGIVFGSECLSPCFCLPACDEMKVAIFIARHPLDIKTESCWLLLIMQTALQKEQSDAEKNQYSSNYPY